MSAAAHRRDVGPEHFGKLYGKCPNATRGAVNQDPLSGLNPPLVAKSPERGECRHRDRRYRRESHRGRFRHYGIFTSARIFGKRATPPPKDLVTDLELRDAATDRCYPARQVHAKSWVFRFAQPVAAGADQKRTPAHEMPVKRIDRRRMNLYQEFTVVGNRLLHFREPKNVR